MASRAARAAARQKKTLTADTIDIEYVGESLQQDAELSTSVLSKTSHSKNRKQTPTKKGGTSHGKKNQGNSLRNEEIQDISGGNSPQQNICGHTLDQRDDDSDICSIEEIDGEPELLEKDSKQRLLKDIMERECQDEAEDEVTLVWDEEEESTSTSKSPDSNKEIKDDELEVLWSKISELESSIQRKDIVSSTIDDDSKENILTKKDPEKINYEELSQTIEVKNCDIHEEISQNIQVKNDDHDRSCEKNSQNSSNIPTFEINETESGRPWAASAKEWVANPIKDITNSEMENNAKNESNVQNYESDCSSKNKRKQKKSKSKNSDMVQQREQSERKELCLQSLQFGVEVEQKDIALNNNVVENASPTRTTENVSHTNIDEQCFHPHEEDMLMETTNVVGTDLNLDDDQVEKRNDSNDQDFIEETVSNINDSKNIAYEDIPNVGSLQGLYYKDHFQYRVENFDGMCEDEFHRIIVADDEVFTPKPNNRFAITLISVNKGGLDFVGIALRETLKNLVSEKSEKLILIRFVCGLCNIVYKYKYNKSNVANIPCCGDCCLWSVRGDFENFYEDYNKLWKSIQSEFPEAVFIPTALPSINVKNIGIFNQHEYCCPHLPTHFSMSGQVVDNMQALFDKSIKFINPALNNLSFEMGFQRVYWTKEKNRSRWTALMKAMQTDSVVARNLQIEKKFIPGDTQVNVNPANIVNIDNELVNQETRETDTNLSTGISLDNLLSSSTLSYEHTRSTSTDNSKVPTQGDLLHKNNLKLEDFGVSSCIFNTTKHASQETEQCNTAYKRDVVAREGNEDIDDQHQGQGHAEDIQNDKGVNRSTTVDPDQEIDESRPVSPKRSWRNSNSYKNKNNTTEKRLSSSPYKPSKKPHLSDTSTNSAEIQGEQSRSPIRFPPDSTSDNIGSLDTMPTNTQASPNNKGHNWKGNLPLKNNQSNSQPWYNNPMWRNKNHNHNNRHHYNNNRSWNNNHQWYNNHPWNNQWNKHSYNPNKYPSHGSGVLPRHRRHWNNNHSNNRRWNDRPKFRNFNSEQSKNKGSPSSSTDGVQSELKDDNQGQNLASTSLPVTHHASQQQNLPSRSQQSNDMSSAVCPTSHQDASSSHLPDTNKIKEEQSSGSYQRIVRIKREPGSIEYWPEDAPMFTIKRGPIDDYRPLKDELKDEQSVK